ncbi:MAG: alpha/beta hydrolase, partial [Clostridia bacterium]
MNLEKIKIDDIPAIIWGEASDKIIIAAHGSHSSKIDDCIWTLAEVATKKGYQVLSFDFPQ